jgi:arsenical pump membrane protein
MTLAQGEQMDDAAVAGTAPPTPATGPRFGVMDWVACVLLAAGIVAILTHLLPASDARATFTRVLPLLIFLGSVIILAELAARAELFDVLAVRLTAIGRGRNVALFLLCMAFAAVTTMFLNLDTTAVLLTPVMLATARRARVPALPLAMTTVWLANTASLLLPVSNLTNLLAANRVGLGPIAFAGRMVLPQVAALLVVGVCLWTFYWRHSPSRYDPPPQHRPADRRTFWVAAAAVAAFIAAILIGVTISIAAVACMVVLVIAFAVWDRSQLRWGLLPWRLLVFVTGLFLVVDTVSRHGLSDVMSALIGSDPGGVGIARAGTVGAVASNVLNNLPVYVAGEAVVPVANHDQLLGLLIGTNVGPLVIPWASLATMLWLERCRAQNLTISWPRFLVTGTITAVLTLTASIGALIITR